jgi:hypothetical protein
VFYMPWNEEISDFFSSITLCWNPRIYPFIRTVSSKFDFGVDRNLKMN